MNHGIEWIPDRDFFKIPEFIFGQSCDIGYLTNIYTLVEHRPGYLAYSLLFSFFEAFLFSFFEAFLVDLLSLSSQRIDQHGLYLTTITVYLR